MNQTPIHKRASSTKWVLPGAALAFLSLAVLADAGDTNQTSKSSNDLDNLTLDQLVNIQVTSVSKRATDLKLSPAAISVITPDDIRRLGITTIPEALRLVPGLDVAQVNANEWAVSSRGFNAEYANKLLVLIDGRSVYTPVSGGVYWNAQDVVMEDLDRIEVIRGPGSTLWGANAVNGVINIITKSAKETQGVMVSGTGGTEDQPTVTVRYGGQLATNLYYRVYAKYFDRKDFVDTSGNDTDDDWHSLRGGFRTDWEPDSANTVTLQGDFSHLIAEKSLTEVSLTPPYSQNAIVAVNHDGANVLGRWTHTFSEESQLSLQAYYDYQKQAIPGDDAEFQQTLDVQLQHQFALGTRQNIVWGAGFNDSFLKDISDFGIMWNPQRRDLQLYNVFAQDDITLVADRLHLTVGSKIEHNSLTGFELEPSARLLWTPTESQTVWAAVSRAVSTPPLYTRDSRAAVVAMPPPAPGFPPILVSTLPNPSEVSEELLAYEIGYRIEPVKQLSFDITGFYNVYHHLMSTTPGNPQPEGSPPTDLLIPYAFGNASSGTTHGLEVSAQWNPTEYWRLTGSYSLLHMDIHPDTTAGDPTSSLYSPKDSPQQQFQIRSYLDLPGHVELNSALYYVDQINSSSLLGRSVVPSYFRLDQGVVWHAAKFLEIGIWGQNLLAGRHLEFNSQVSSLQTEVPRGVLGKITMRF